MIVIGIDATSIVDGGGFTHLSQFFINYLKVNQQSTHQMNIYASKKVLDQLPEHPKFLKRNFSYLNKYRFHRIFFQSFLFDKILKKECDILFSVTENYIGDFRPSIGMSHNIMLYEREFRKEINNYKEKGKFYFNFKRQHKCFRNAEGIIFLSQYVKNYITKALNIKDKNIAIIYYGILNQFLTDNIEIKPL